MTLNPAQSLAHRIWFTRKAWIAAEKRLLDNEYHTQLLLVVYSAYTTCISVILLSYESKPVDKKLIDTAMVVLAVILFGLSLYLNSKSFKDRAARFKSGYLDLHDIEIALGVLSAQFGTAGTITGSVQILSDRYTKALRDVENHSEIDDICGRRSAGIGLTSRHLSRGEQVRHCWWRIWRWMALAAMYMMPIAAVVWFVLK